MLETPATTWLYQGSDGMVTERGKGSLFPEGWCDASLVEKVCAWIRWLDIDDAEKKQILLLWCDCAGVKLTRDLVIKVLGEEGG